MPASGKAAKRGYAGRDAQQRSSERRVRLLDAALVLFCDRGYACTRIEQICSEARISTRQFYELFPDRESVLAALLDAVTAQTQTAVMQALGQPADGPTEQVMHALRAFIHHYLDDPRRARLACVEVVGVSAAMEQRRRRIIHDWARLIEAHALMLAARGELPAGHYHLVGVALVGAVNEVMIDCITAVPPPSVEQAQDTLLAMFRGLIDGARAPTSAVR